MEEAKVGSLEMRAKVRGDEWVRRLTAGRDIVKKCEKDQCQDPKMIKGEELREKQKTKKI